MGGSDTSELGMSALCYMSNSDGMVGLCSTSVHEGGGDTCHLGMSAFLHMSNSDGVVQLCSTSVHE